MPHWTYTTFNPENDLEQGDIIRRTPDLLAILGEAHNYFLDGKYSAFVVLTQSCDLVRRKHNSCKSRYINLCVVRPLDDMLELFLNSECEKVKVSGRELDKVYTNESRARASQLITRIINQNEQGQGIFYLHPDVDAGIAVPSVSLLQVSIALRCCHYSTLLNSRMGRLHPEFQSRLGWLMGHLYSRVATHDWDQTQSNRIVEDILSNAIWIPRESIQEAQRQEIDLDGKTSSEIAEIIKCLPAITPKEKAIDRTIQIIRDILQNVPDNKLGVIRTRLLNDQLYSFLFRR